MQIVASGPSSDDKSIRNTLLAVMGSAKIDLDCYTILYSDQETLTLLRLSAISGIDVRILYPVKVIVLLVTKHLSPTSLHF